MRLLVCDTASGREGLGGAPSSAYAAAPASASWRLCSKASKVVSATVTRSCTKSNGSSTVVGVSAKPAAAEAEPEPEAEVRGRLRSFSG